MMPRGTQAHTTASVAHADKQMRARLADEVNRSTPTDLGRQDFIHRAEPRMSRGWPVCQKTLASVCVTKSVPTCSTKKATSAPISLTMMGRKPTSPGSSSLCVRRLPGAVHVHQGLQELCEEQRVEHCGREVALLLQLVAHL